MSIELKIKAKHLALEPGIIEHEEAKIRRRIKWLQDRKQDVGNLWWELRSLELHRKNNVRDEARATNLARTFIAGKPYTHTEQRRNSEREGKFQYYIIPRIAAMAKKYGTAEQRKLDDKVLKDQITAWSRI